MKLIRWPALTLMLAILLVGFFVISQVDDNGVRQRFETIATRELDTVVRLGALDVSVFRSTLRGENLQVTDPGQRGRNIFVAREFQCWADLARFFERRVLLDHVYVSGVYVRVQQLRNGHFAFLNEAALRLAQYAPVGLRVKNIMTWTADNMNPLRTFAAQKEGEEAARRGTPATVREPVPPLAHGTTQIVARGFVLNLPRDYPDLVIRRLTLEDATIEVVPYGATTSIVLHGISGVCENLSSRPNILPEPISFRAHGYAGFTPPAPFAADGSVDLFAEQRNVQVEFALSNMALRTLLPIAEAYSPYFRLIDLAAGNLTTRGMVLMRNRAVVPTELTMQLDHVTANFEALKDVMPWLRMLHFSDSSLTMQVPLDGRRPYLHFDEAFKQQKVSTEIRNLELQFNPRDANENFLDGLLNKAIKDAQ
jgi:hypothetical protein